MLKQVIDAFEINQYLMFYCARLGCDDIHHYLTKIDETDFYGEPNSSAGTQNKNVWQNYVVVRHEQKEMEMHYVQ